jgi:hypothetical protein
MKIDSVLAGSCELAMWNARVLLCSVPLPWTAEHVVAVAQLADFGQQLFIQVQEQAPDGPEFPTHPAGSCYTTLCRAMGGH